MNCKKCNNEISKADKICTKCGEKIIDKKKIMSISAVLVSFILGVCTSLYSHFYHLELTPMIYIDGKYGYTDKEGKIVIEPQYDGAGTFSEGLAKVEINGKYGYINKRGKMVIEPQYDLAWRFSEGLASVKINGKHGYIDKRGKIVIEPQYDLAGDFREGLALVEINRNPVYIDKHGNVVTELEY